MMWGGGQLPVTPTPSQDGVGWRQDDGVTDDQRRGVRIMTAQETRLHRTVAAANRARVGPEQ
jgi:hypothetical protein